jgi:hypothetical protein
MHDLVIRALSSSTVNLLTSNLSVLHCTGRSGRVYHGCAVAPAVSRRLPAAAARVRARVKSCGICGGHSGTGAGFLPVLRFPLPLIHSTNCSQSSPSITHCWYNKPINDRSNSGLGSTPAKKTYKNISTFQNPRKPIFSSQLFVK